MKMKPQQSQFEKQPVYLNAQTERKCEKNWPFWAYPFGLKLCNIWFKATKFSWQLWPWHV